MLLSGAASAAVAFDLLDLTVEPEGAFVHLGQVSALLGELGAFPH